MSALLYAHARGAVSELRLATDSPALHGSSRVETSHFFVLLSRNSVLLPYYLASCFSETPLVGWANSSVC